MRRVICGILLVAALIYVLALSGVAAEDPVAVRVPVRIELKGQTSGTGDHFTVEITAKTPGAPMPDEPALSIEGAGSGTFVISYSELGVYSYTVRQIPGNNPDCAYDTAVYTITVYVTSNGSGGLEVTTLVFDSSDEKVNTAVFTNEYASTPIEPAELDPPIEKIVEVKSGSAPDDSVFTFVMIPSNRNAPMPENDEAERDPSTGALIMKKKGPGSYEFGIMHFDEDDIGRIYTYTLKELPGEDSRYTYDAQIYTMTVKVSEENGKIELKVTYTNKSGRSADKAVFKNVFSDPSTTPPSTDTAKPATDTTQSEPDSPQTGDSLDLNNIVILLLADLIAAGAVAVHIVKRKTRV